MGTVAAGGAGGRAGGGIGSEGAGASLTGDVLALGAGGGSGADGSWIGAVARFGATVGTPEVIALTGGTGAPSPERARSVMRTVSFLSGTEEVLGLLVGGGRFSDSLMGRGEIGFGGNGFLAGLGGRRQSLFRFFMTMRLVFKGPCRSKYNQ